MAVGAGLPLAPASGADAGIVDENIQPRLVALDSLRQMPHLGERGQIGLIETGLPALPADFGHEGFAPIPIPAVNQHVRA